MRLPVNGSLTALALLPVISHMCVSDSHLLLSIVVFHSMCDCCRATRRRGDLQESVFIFLFLNFSRFYPTADHVQWRFFRLGDLILKLNRLKPSYFAVRI
jgi:hypothetical protein